MARKNALLQYALIGGIGYALWTLLRPMLAPKVTAGGGAPATNSSGTTGGAVPGSPNQVLTADQELATAISHGYRAGI